MPPKISQEKLAKYKNHFVGKYLEKHPIKEVEQLPYDDLKELWSQGKYKEFLEVALDRLKLLQILPEVCPTLNLSNEQKVQKHLQDIDYTLKTFKEYFRSQNKDIRGKMMSRAREQLPTDLRKLFFSEKWGQFLTKALQKFARKLKLSNCLLAICPTLGRSRQEEVHKLVQRFYLCYCDSVVITKSRKAYISKTKIFELVPDYWLEMWGKGIVERRQKERRLQKNYLAMLKKWLRTRDNRHVCDVEKLIFKESDFIRRCQETPQEVQDRSLLFKVAKEFFLNIGIWLKLDGQFHELPGVYFLYYIGKKELYPGSFIIGSLSVPVYVGMSTYKISRRLRDHRAKIDGAKHLRVADFAVKVMFVDNRHYAPCLEGMFIEHFAPVWNKETLGICFGFGPRSLWKKYHVDEDPDICNDMEQKLNICGGQSESETEASED